MEIREREDGGGMIDTKIKRIEETLGKGLVSDYRTYRKGDEGKGRREGKDRYINTENT